MSAPLVLWTHCGYGGSRGIHHSQSLEAMFLHFPGLKVVLPSTPWDAKGLLKSSLRDEDPVIFMDHVSLFAKKGPVPEEEYTIPLGEAEVKKEGKDATIVAFSAMVHESLRAAEKLAGEGSEVEVLDPRTLVPLDLSTIVGSVRKTNRLLLVEAGNKRGGVGAEIISSIVEEVFDYLDFPPIRLAVPDTPLAIRLADGSSFASERNPNRGRGSTDVAIGARMGCCFVGPFFQERNLREIWPRENFPSSGGWDEGSGMTARFANCETVSQGEGVFLDFL